MAYLMIAGTDVSDYVNELKVEKQANYNAQTNAAGDTVVDLINFKRTIEVGFIPMEDADIQPILALFDNRLDMAVTYRDPVTGAMIGVNCILPSRNIEYYTIQVGRVMYKAFTLTFQEL